MFDMKQSFIEFLLINDKHQIIIDILLHKIRKDGNKELCPLLKHFIRRGRGMLFYVGA